MAIKEKPVLRDVTGRYLTRALFVELAEKDNMEKYPPMCTLKEAHDLYMEIADPTEYLFAKALLESPETTFWDHWKRLLAMDDFMFHLSKWREELEVKLRANAIKTIKLASVDPEKGITAAKWLAEKGFKEKKGAGRRSNDDIMREKKIQAGINSELDDDAKRISLVS